MRSGACSLIHARRMLSASSCARATSASTPWLSCGEVGGAVSSFFASLPSLFEQEGNDPEMSTDSGVRARDGAALPMQPPLATVAAAAHQQAAMGRDGNQR